MRFQILVFLFLVCGLLTGTAQPTRILPVTAARTAAEGPGLSVYRGNPVTLRVRLDATRPTATGLESLTAEIRSRLTDRTDALASSQILTPTGAGPFDLEFSGAQLNLDLAGKPSRQLWLVIYSSKDVGETLDTWHAGKINVLETGATMANPAPNVVGPLSRPNADLLFPRIRAEGFEYLGAYNNKVVDGEAPVIVLAGDSQMAGFAITNAAYRPEYLLKNALEQFFPVSVFNDAINGTTAKDWLNTLPAQIARNPDLMIISFGVNDGASNRADFETDLRAGLALIRASRTLEQTSIIIETPAATNDSPNGRDAPWYESITPKMQKAAKDYQACFHDKYHLFPDAAAGSAWYDNPYGNNRHVHQLEALNLQINESRLDLILCENTIRPLTPAATANVPSSVLTPSAGEQTGFYSQWISQYRATTNNGWPFDGSAITFRQRDGVWLQFNVPYAGNGYAIRTGGTRIGAEGGWNPMRFPLLGASVAADAAGVPLNDGAGNYTFASIVPTVGNVVPASGFNQDGGEGMGVLKHPMTPIAFGRGFLHWAALTTIPAGTLIGTIPAGYRPGRYTAYGLPLAAWNGSSSWQYPHAHLFADGSLVLQETISFSCHRLYFASASWSLD